MRSKILACALVLFAFATSGLANAKGCLKGAAVGAVGGHVAGHHGLLGAAAGCAVGRHLANKRDAAGAAPKPGGPAPAASASQKG